LKLKNNQAINWDLIDNILINKQNSNNNFYQYLYSIQVEYQEYKQNKEANLIKSNNNIDNASTASILTSALNLIDTKQLENKNKIYCTIECVNICKQHYQSFVMLMSCGKESCHCKSNYEVNKKINEMLIRNENSSQLNFWIFIFLIVSLLIAAFYLINYMFIGRNHENKWVTTFMTNENENVPDERSIL